MIYTSGLPPFDVEKPMLVPWQSSALLMMEESDHIGEIKLNEARGFLTISDQGEITYFNRYRKKIDLDPAILADLKKMKLPQASVFDGGYLRNKTHKICSLYLFDILIFEGKKVHWPFSERMAFVDKHIKITKQVWRPFRTTKFIHEFGAMLKGVSPLVKEAAKVYQIDAELLNGFVEGFVIKSLDGKHGFPNAVKKSPHFAKIRKIDVLKKDKVWLLPVEGQEES